MLLLLLPAFIIISSRFGLVSTQVCAWDQFLVGSPPTDRIKDYPFSSSFVQIFDYLQAPCDAQAVAVTFANIGRKNVPLRFYLGTFENVRLANVNYYRLTNYAGIDVPVVDEAFLGNTTVRTIDLPYGTLPVNTGQYFGIFYDNWQADQTNTVVPYQGVFDAVNAKLFPTRVGLMGLPELAKISQLRMGTELVNQVSGRLVAMAITLTAGLSTTSATTEAPPASSTTTVMTYRDGCGPAPRVPNGYITFKSFETELSFVFDTIEYSCLPGFRMVLGDYYRVTCTERMRWSELPVCIVDLNYRPYVPPPPTFPQRATTQSRPIEVARCPLSRTTLLNGAEERRTFIGNEALAGESIVYRCYTGFELIGLNGGVVTCYENGTWSPMPICLRNRQACNTQPRPSNAVLYSQTFRLGQRAVDGDQIVYLCLEGYSNTVRSGNPTTDRRYVYANCRNGFWDDDNPRCYSNSVATPAPTPAPPQTCGEPPRLANALESRRTWFPGFRSRPGDKVLYVCNRGYTLRGSGEAICLGDLLWSIRFECYATSGNSSTRSPFSDYSDQTCGLPPVIENAFTETSTASRVGRVGDFVLYSCRRGYVMVGSANVFCTADYTWTVRFRCVART